MNFARNAMRIWPSMSPIEIPVFIRTCRINPVKALTQSKYCQNTTDFRDSDKTDPPIMSRNEYIIGESKGSDFNIQADILPWQGYSGKYHGSAARLNIADIPQHIVQRGNNRQATFFSDDDYVVYPDKLHEYANKYKVSVHAFILMTIHLLLTPSTKSGASELMQSLGRYYVLYINRTYARSGTLWEGRFKSTPVDEVGYFLSVSRYIELNPVRAKMVSHARDYPWSSYQGNALDNKISLLTPHQCYLALGKDDKMRRKSYRAFFRRTIPEAVLEEIRTSTQKGWAIGNDRFRAEIEEKTNRRASPQPRGGDRRSKKYTEHVKKT